MKVLIVDDDPAIRRLVALGLQSARVDLLEASTAAEAIACARATSPGLILLDVVLPDGDGREVLRALRSDPATAAIPVVFLTALADARDVVELLASGAEDVITKPLDIGRLPRHLARFLGRADAFPLAGGFAHLQRDFLRGSEDRLKSLERCLDVLEQDRTDIDALRELRRHLHSLVGTSASLGFGSISALARLGEKECELALREGAAPDERDVERWRGVAGTLRREIAGVTVTMQGGAAAQSSASVRRSHEILLVGNDDELGSIGQRLLRNAGYEVRIATSRRSALGAISAKVPDALVVDKVLPDGPADDLIQDLRAIAGGDACAVMIISSGPGFLDKVDALSSGASGYFEKPVDWEAVSRRLQHLLHESVSEPARVLYVEDDAEQASVVQWVLESAGFEVRICADPRHFDADLISFAPDLVLMDVLLPSLSGYDLVRYLRQNEAYATLPVLFLTAKGELDAQISSARAGGDDHLVKPVPPPLLVAQVSTRVERARFVRSLINRDGLTGLLTHSALLESAKVALAQRHRDPDIRMVLVMVDIDEFKSINDRFGHPTGDRTLTTLAAFLRRRVRQSDVLGRYGGDEFSLIIYNVDEDRAVRLMSKIAEEFAAYELHSADGTPFHATFSAGVAELGPVATLEAWRDAADNALYGAKAAGRNCVVAASRLNELLADLINRSS